MKTALYCKNASAPDDDHARHHVNTAAQRFGRIAACRPRAAMRALARTTRVLLQLVCAGQLRSTLGDVIWTEWEALEGWPPARAKSAVVLSERVGYLDTDPQIMMFGGSDTEGVRSDMWTASLAFLPVPSIELEADPATAGSVELNPSDAPAWVKVEQSGAWPDARCDHSMTALSDGRVVLFGGTGHEDGSADAMNDLWLYDVRDQWSQVERPVNGSTATCDTDGRLWPYKRFGHTSMALGTTMWVFGGWISGCGQNSVTDELWSYNPDQAVVTDGFVMSVGWQRQRPMSLRPSARTGHNMLGIASHVAVLGGWDGTSPTDDMWSYDPATTKWTQLHTDNTPDEPPPAQRYGAAVEPVAGGMVIYGGSDRGAPDGTDSFFDDIWVFTFNADEAVTTKSISESMGDGSGTMTKTTTIRTVPTNKNLWMQQTPGKGTVPMRAYHGTLVWGNPGYEHIVVVGGTDQDGKPTYGTERQPQHAHTYTHAAVLTCTHCSHACCISHPAGLRELVASCFHPTYTRLDIVR
jgi:N-acetylneuraminic acid mutarotase